MPKNPTDESGRLDSLRRLSLLDTAPEQSFDRLVALAQRFLSSKVALLSLIDKDRQFFKAAVGLPAPVAQIRETPLDYSFCKHVVAANAVLAVEDAVSDPRVSDNPAVTELGIRSYLGQPVYSPDGHAVGTLCVADTEPRKWCDADISVLKDLADLATGQISLRRYQRMHEATDQLIRKIASRVRGVVYQYRLRPDGSSHFPFASDGIRQIYRVAPEEVVEDAGKVFAVLHPDDKPAVVESILASAASLEPWLHKYRVRFADGTILWLLGDAVPEREPDGSTLWHGYITDITEREEAEEKRAAFERQLQETQKLESLGVLAGGIAHDFNNILTGILGNASLASMELAPYSPVHGHMEAIKQGARRAADLCNQMLAYSGKGKFVVKKLSLNLLVEETMHLLRISISKNAVLRFNLYPALPAIAADATQIRQVIMNLVINGSEAIGERSGVICVNTGLTRIDKAYMAGTMHAPELPDGTYVYLEISDSGCGMSAETKAKIFDPFFTTKFSGRGLGLAAVIGIVRGHNGALKVYSEVGKGTTFKLLFPMVAGEADGPTEEGSSNPPWKAHGTVLVVDDEESVRSAAAQMLKRMGLDVALASDGRQAVEIFRSNPSRFNLVLMDLTMPHVDGRQAYRELRQIQGDVRVLLMSGFNEQDALSEFMGKGIAGFLQKPFEINNLSKLVQKALNVPESAGGAPKDGVFGEGSPRLN